MNNSEALVAIFGMITGVLITWGLGWGIVRGIREWRGGGQPDRLLEGEVGALRDQVEQMQQQLIEAHERLDFTERLLSQSRTPEQLPGEGR
jgi:hypothetical protein